MTDLRELLARCEKASGPDRELDYALDEHFSASVLTGCERIETGWLSPQYGKIRGPEEYTSSLDAAVALVEHMLPGWHWRVNGPYASATLGKTDMSDDVIADGETPALALVAALLKSLIAGEEKGRG